MAAEPNRVWRGLLPSRKISVFQGKPQVANNKGTQLVSPFQCKLFRFCSRNEFSKLDGTNTKTLGEGGTLLQVPKSGLRMSNSPIACGLHEAWNVHMWRTITGVVWVFAKQAKCANAHIFFYAAHKALKTGLEFSAMLDRRKVMIWDGSGVGCRVGGMGRRPEEKATRKCTLKIGYGRESLWTTPMNYSHFLKYLSVNSVRETELEFFIWSCFYAALRLPWFPEQPFTGSIYHVK